MVIEVERKAKIRNRYNQVAYLTRNTIIWESEKTQENITHKNDTSHFKLSSLVENIRDRKYLFPWSFEIICLFPDSQNENNEFR